MGYDAIDQNICLEVLGTIMCSIARGQRPSAIEHLIVPSTEGQIFRSIASSPIKELFYYLIKHTMNNHFFKSFPFLFKKFMG